MTNSRSGHPPISIGRRGLAGRVRLRFKSDMVSVSGTLTRWAEKDALLALLRHAPGVHRIDDHIVVQTPA
jgi:hypothetical protein